MKKAVVFCLVLAATLAAQEGARTLRPVVRGTRAVVAAGSPFATEAGLRLLHQKGTAVDAGIAATFAAAVVEFSHFGFGGEVPVLVRTREGRLAAVSGVGTAAKLATAAYYRARQPDPSDPRVEPGAAPGQIPSSGILSAMVPGMVDGMLLTLRDYGTRSFAEVIQPALELAEGFPIDETRSSYIERYRGILEKWPEAAAVFLPGGRAPQPGEIFHQPNLARTLRGMAEAERLALAAGKSRAEALDVVRDYFYRGPVAREIDRFNRANGGLLRYEDLAGFHAEMDTPVRADYRGFEVYKAGFWTQGPVMVEALNLLEGQDLKQKGHNSAGYIHTLVESLKLAYADRDSFYGDPKFASIPRQTLLSKEYAAERRRLIEANVASREPRPGSPDGIRALHPAFFPPVAGPPGVPAHDTTCVVAMDASGVVFSATPSGAWTPAVIAGSTGIPLTQRLQSFLLIPGHPNELAPGKRPRVTLTPTLVLRNGKPYLALATPGGDNQDQALLQVLLNILEFGMNPQQAVEAPRFETRHLVSSFDDHSFRPGLLYLDERMEAARKTLESWGHDVKVRTLWRSGSAPVVARYRSETGALEAGADPYAHRYAAGW